MAKVASASEVKMPEVKNVSARSMPPTLLAIIEKLQAEVSSNQSYLINGVPAVWCGPKKTLYYGPSAIAISGETLNDAVKTAVK